MLYEVSFIYTLYIIYVRAYICVCVCVCVTESLGGIAEINTAN